MGVIGEASCPIADFSKFIIVAHIQVPQASFDGPAGSASVLEFGQDTDGPSGISVSGSKSLGFIFVGPHNGYTYDTQGSTQTETAQIGINTPDDVIVADAWHPIGLSGDFSGTASFPFDSGPDTYSMDHCDYRAWLTVNDVDYSPTAVSAGTGGPFSGPSGIITPVLTGSFGDISGPAFTISLSGFEWGIPSRPSVADPTYNSVIRFSNPRIWTGVSCDFSDVTNRRKFWNADLSPANPAIATAAFGAPVREFIGNAAAWSAAAIAYGMTKTGTVSDFSPPPP